MRENGKCFVTQDVAVVDDLDGIQSLVYLQDQESIGSFNKTYGDSFLRSSAIGQMAFNELADEIVNQIVNRRGAQAMNTDEIPQQMHSHENDLRVIGQALEALGIESFELALDGDNFVVHGGPELAPREKPLTPNRLQRFEWTRRKKVKPQQSRFFISGMRFRESDVIRLDRQGKDIRLSPERCPDTNSLSHSLRMIGAHIDKKGGILLRVIRYNRLFTVWHKSSLGAESKEIFTQSNLYDLWVHLYKKRRNVGLKRNGTTRNGF